MTGIEQREKEFEETNEDNGKENQLVAGGRFVWNCRAAVVVTGQRGAAGDAGRHCYCCLLYTSRCV